jgi:protein phosphatase 1 regulatory subunit 37
MIRDYPDVLAAPSSANSSVPPSPTVGSHSLPFDAHHGPGHPASPHNYNHSNTHTGGGSILPPSLSKLAPAPPPRHPSAAAQPQKQTLTAAQTTYTPYVPRRRQQSANAGATAAAGAGAGATSTKAVVASSVLGGVTARHVPSPVPSFSSVDSGLGLGAAADLRDREAQVREREREREKERERERDGPSAALLDKVRALDALPRVGALRTLDLRGNDLRVSWRLGLLFRCSVLTNTFAERYHVHRAGAEAEPDAEGAKSRGE